MKQFSLNEYLSNPSRKVVTRDGHPVRIICTDAKTEHPIIALLEESGKEYIQTYTPDGKAYKYNGKCQNADLFFAPEKKEGWVSLYRNVRGNLVFGLPYCTKEEAIDELYDDTDTRIDTIKVEWEE